MGASSWISFVPYDADFDEALWLARRAVFQAGDYQAPYGMSGPEAAQLTDDEVEAAMAEFVGVDITEFEGWQDAVPEPAVCPPPRDELDEQIARVLNMTMDAGTHSILDVCRVTNDPGFGNVIPMTEADVERVLGTTKPTRADVEHAKERLWQLCPRWEGRLVVTYNDIGKPNEICFLGASGD